MARFFGANLPKSTKIRCSPAATPAAWRKTAKPPFHTAKARGRVKIVRRLCGELLANEMTAIPMDRDKVQLRGLDS
jgi:hypothetical protein